jgi:hypothetical protein
MLLIKITNSYDERGLVSTIFRILRRRTPSVESANGSPCELFTADFPHGGTAYSYPKNNKQNKGTCSYLEISMDSSVKFIILRTRSALNRKLYRKYLANAEATRTPHVVTSLSKECGDASSTTADGERREKHVVRC